MTRSLTLHPLACYLAAIVVCVYGAVPASAQTPIPTAPLEPTTEADSSFITDACKQQQSRQSAVPKLAQTPTATETATPSVSASAPVEAEVLRDRLQLRAGPGVNYPITHQLRQGNVVAVVGRFGKCSWWQVKVTDGDEKLIGQFGWMPGNRNLINFRQRCDSLPVGVFQPVSGVIHRDAQDKQRDRAGKGWGTLTISNGTPYDGNAVLTFLDDRRKPIWGVYVRSNENFKVTGIQDGVYCLFFTTGSEWDDVRRRFMQPIRHTVFEDAFSFTTTEHNNVVNYQTFTATLHVVEDGNAETEPVDEDEFPSAPAVDNPG